MSSGCATRRLIRRVLFGGVLTTGLVVSQTLNAYPVRIVGGQNWISSAVDAQGVRHSGKDYAGKRNSPWMDYAVKTVNPDYPYTEKAHRIGGFGLYRVTLDLKTGSVSKVAVIQSTGVPTLDDSAMKALRQWLWKPGKWKEVDVPIAFIPRYH
jgi:TonB family protein